MGFPKLWTSWVIDDIIKKEKSMLNIKETLHLCDTCEHEFYNCKGNMKFGTGKGNDNVYECDAYANKT